MGFEVAVERRVSEYLRVKGVSAKEPKMKRSTTCSM